jgi:REP element-mobilizing transposase RayT
VSDYKHWKNCAQAHETAFITTTCLDFVHALAPYRLRDLMVASMLEDCRRTKTVVHAFVVMPHHLHLLAHLTTCSASRLAQRIKSNSARRILPRMPTRLKSQFHQQVGLNGRTFWKVGFRSVVVVTPRVFRQKARYIHLNPVEAQLSETTWDYRWSSAWAGRDGLWTPATGLDLEQLIKFYARHGLPPI